MDFTYINLGVRIADDPLTHLLFHYRLPASGWAYAQVVYETAKEARPERWKNRSVRNWKPLKEVWLNPSKESNELERNVVLAA